MAGEAANGARGHVALSADAPLPAVQAFKEKFVKRFGYVPDHNGLKGYTAVYAVKYATQKIGKFDRRLLAKTMHGLTIKPEQEPGILMEASWDDKGDIDRISFLAEVVGGRQKIRALAQAARKHRLTVAVDDPDNAAELSAAAGEQKRGDQRPPGKKA